MTRATPPWDRLKELAAKRRDAEAQRLSAAVRTRDEAERRLAMLTSYRADYQARLSASSRSEGGSPSSSRTIPSPSSDSRSIRTTSCS